VRSRLARLLCFYDCEAKVKTIVYVDAFNLYYGCLKNTSYRWLDLEKLCQLLLPRDNVVEIKYFTALVSARPQDPKQPVRQQTYIRALKTNPKVKVILGHFLSHVVTMRLAAPAPGGPQYARVVKTEEKGSDVNLATHLLHDGHLGNYELAVVISNDSDLLEPIKIVNRELGLPVGILNPHKHPSAVLIAEAHFHKHIRKGVLRASLFPPTLTDKIGTFHKPPKW
jgi:hypothetical protein